MKDKARETEAELLAAGDLHHFEQFIWEPHPHLSWTRQLPEYSEARGSAMRACLRLFAATTAAQAGIGSMPANIAIFLHKVSVGLIQDDDPDICETLAGAQQDGKGTFFLNNLARARENARRRKKPTPGSENLGGINVFRFQVAAQWMHYGLWLMSDDLIARTLINAKARKEGCNRQTVSRLVKEMQLKKNSQLLIAGLNEKGCFIFKPGYPAKG